MKEIYKTRGESKFDRKHNCDDILSREINQSISVPSVRDPDDTHISNKESRTKDKTISYSNSKQRKRQKKQHCKVMEESQLNRNGIEKDYETKVREEPDSISDTDFLTLPQRVKGTNFRGSKITILK